MIIVQNLILFKDVLSLTVPAAKKCILFFIIFSAKHLITKYRPIIMIITSSSSSGAFFCVTSLLVSIQLKNIQWIPKEISLKVCLQFF